MKPTITTLGIQFDRDEISAIEHVHGVVKVCRDLKAEVDDDYALIADCIENIMYLYNDDPYNNYSPLCKPDTESIEEFAMLLETMLLNSALDTTTLLKELRDLFQQEIDRIF